MTPRVSSLSRIGSLVALPAAAFAFLALVPSGCANSIDVGVEGHDAGVIDETPTFTPRPDGGDASTDVFTPTRAMCMATSCPAPYASCGGDYLCQTNLSSDPNNCGECGSVCPETFGYLNMTSSCVNGACVPACGKTLVNGGFNNWADCNKILEDGCEVSLSRDPNNCGACGNKCPDGVNCLDGKCGCPAGLIECEGSCIDARSDERNCGACKSFCQTTPSTLAHMENACVDGECGKPRCKKGYSDCDKDQSNGCEVLTGIDAGKIDRNNCGGCGIKCKDSEVCFDSNYDGVPECLCQNPAETLCTDGYNYACHDLLSDLTNCGTCGHDCTSYLENAAGACRKGMCEVECNPGWGDCDGVPQNGCETNLMVSNANCGTCGTRCDTQAGQPCVEGKCAMVECDAGVQPQ
ncbi:hypothetical protein AKJ09_04102 [Labilithrix luteola]|uniref:Tryptophan synthase alpha chain n=1 Tax=Labilithrix luteola TaxID=1391654 RepID=A0A0K1PV79_9BACT|nr:hypothetical protein [Labilithrix luteola]AKU97438.1 hypothetical protein AKJ09_04102 [Labilithrix luteola]